MLFTRSCNSSTRGVTLDTRPCQPVRCWRRSNSSIFKAESYVWEKLGFVSESADVFISKSNKNVRIAGVLKWNEDNEFNFELIFEVVS